MRIIGVVTLHGIFFAYAQVLQIFGEKHHTSCTSWGAAGQQGDKNKAVKPVTFPKSSGNTRTDQALYCWCFLKHGRKMHKILVLKLVWYLHTHETN